MDRKQAIHITQRSLRRNFTGKVDAGSMLDLLAVTVDYEPLHSGIHVPATTTALEAISYLSATEINSKNNPKSKS